MIHPVKNPPCKKVHPLLFHTSIDLGIQKKICIFPPLRFKPELYLMLLSLLRLNASGFSQLKKKKKSLQWVAATKRVKTEYLHIKCLLDKLFFLLQLFYIHGGFLLNHSSFLSCLIFSVTSVTMWSIFFLRQIMMSPEGPVRLWPF